MDMHTVCLFVYLSICLSVCLSVCLSRAHTLKHTHFPNIICTTTMQYSVLPPPSGVQLLSAFHIIFILPGTFLSYHYRSIRILPPCPSLLLGNPIQRQALTKEGACWRCPVWCLICRFQTHTHECTHTYRYTHTCMHGYGPKCVMHGIPSKDMLWMCQIHENRYMQMHNTHSTHGNFHTIKYKQTDLDTHTYTHNHTFHSHEARFYSSSGLASLYQIHPGVPSTFWGTHRQMFHASYVNPLQATQTLQTGESFLYGRHSVDSTFFGTQDRLLHYTWSIWSCIVSRRSNYHIYFFTIDIRRSYFYSKQRFHSWWTCNKTYKQNTFYISCCEPSQNIQSNFCIIT